MKTTAQNGSGNRKRAARWLRLLTAGLFTLVLANGATVGATGETNHAGVTGIVQAALTAGTETVQDLQQFLELIRLREASAIAAVAPAPVSQNSLLKFCSAPTEPDPSVIPATKKSRS